MKHYTINPCFALLRDWECACSSLSWSPACVTCPVVKKRLPDLQLLPLSSKSKALVTSQLVFLLHSNVTLCIIKTRIYVRGGMLATSLSVFLKSKELILVKGWKMDY